ncbi:MAG TPA: hypothetical protein VKX46_09550 [Ktedonobacteraceae bacterium]|jgi:hypothetical protein|nr:hypothetical protein [Ktedonobacteraceae bacterium]
MRVLLWSVAALVVVSLALAYQTGGVQSALVCAVFFAALVVVVAFGRWISD